MHTHATIIALHRERHRSLALLRGANPDGRLCERARTIGLSGRWSSSRREDPGFLFQRLTRSISRPPLPESTAASAGSGPPGGGKRESRAGQGPIGRRFERCTHALRRHGHGSCRAPTGTPAASSRSRPSLARRSSTVPTGPEREDSKISDARSRRFGGSPQGLAAAARPSR